MPAAVNPPGSDPTQSVVAGQVDASGFAAAAAPVQAQTLVVTDGVGLIAGEVAIVSGEIEIPAYRAAPAHGRLAPALLIVHEVFGVHEHIKDVCRRFAHLGFFAVAPQLYFRQGDPAKISDVPTLIAQIVSKVPDSQVLADLDAAASWAAAQGADANRLGITGFCWGGRICWLYAAHSPRLRAAIAWYGRLVGAATALTPSHPIDVAARLHVPVLGLYGGADSSIPAQTIENMKRALARNPGAGARSEFVVYPEAPHAFFADYRPNYREAPARDGWARCLAWLKANGIAP